MAEKKITKREKFEGIKTFLEENGKSEWAKVIGHEIELLDRKASKVDTKKNEEHDALMGSIKTALYAKGERMTCSEIMKAVNTAEGADYSLNKISAMLSKLGEKGTNEVVKVIEKKVAYFTLAD